MLTFGFTTTIDLLSWIVGCALGMKVLATLALLLADREARDRSGWGSVLWWLTKATPVVAVPCLIRIARLEDDTTLVRLFLLLGMFVIIAVPIKVRQRRDRIANRSLDRRRSSAAGQR